MRRLNYRVEEEGGSYAQVAKDFLVSEGLLKGESSPSAVSGAVARQEQGLGDYLWSRRAETGRLTLEHLCLTFTAVLLAVAVAIPLGIFLAGRKLLAGPFLGAAGIIQTIPSLALLAFMIPVPGLGLGARSAIAALFLYALLPILRNTYTGIRGVEADLVEAAQGMGLTPRQILRRVKLPLAMPTIMAGVRTATIISIGIATLAAFIGAGGLGDPIVTGLQLNDTSMILSGAIPAALLAVAVDLLLGLVEKGLAPGRGKGSKKK
jgi:osmoprotectant transport system permease protein